MKPIHFSQHALHQMPDRGTVEQEVITTISSGERLPAKRGRVAFRKNFPFEQVWKGRYYETKQVMPIVTEEPGGFFVVTVYVFYFGGKQ